MSENLQIAVVADARHVVMHTSMFFPFMICSLVFDPRLRNAMVTNYAGYWLLLDSTL